MPGSFARQVGRDVEAEVLDAMPSAFVHRYEMLWMKAFGRSVGGGSRFDGVLVANARRVVRVSTNQTEVRGGAKHSKAPSPGGVDVASESALYFKRKVDRKLRALAREMKVWLDGSAHSGQRRCSRCKRYGDAEWLYCPWDRAPMEEVDT